MSAEEENRICLHCGQAIPAGQKDCPACAANGIRGFTPQAVLLLSLPALVVFFVLTGYAARSYHAKRRALALRWFARAQAELQAQRPEAALRDLRDALAYSPDNEAYQLRLAQALLAVNRAGEARTYLLKLWERAPGNGEVNLALARLEARQGDLQEAIRYYHGAIDGLWADKPQRRRWETRLELCEFLLQRGANGQAQMELIGLSANVPPAEPALHSQVGALFLEAQDPAHALEVFRLVLHSRPRDPSALAGAGEAAFQNEDYQLAERYLASAVREDKTNSQAADRSQLTRVVLASDPFQPGLIDRLRAQRVKRAFDQALARLKDCAARRKEDLATSAPGTGLPAAYAETQKLNRPVHSLSLRRQPALATRAMGLVFQIEELTAGQCGLPTGLDEALLLLAKEHATARH